MKVGRTYSLLLLAALSASLIGCNVIIDFDDYTEGSGGNASTGGPSGVGGAGGGSGGSGGNASAGGSGGMVGMGGAAGMGACIAGTVESCYSGAPVTLGVGVCVAGTKSCDNGVWTACADEVMPSGEICNSLDDDCNGVPDDLGTFQCGLGACAVTVAACVSGQEGLCVPLPGSAVEACDGVDDSCDGQVDEGCACVDGVVEDCYSGGAGEAGVGECKAGTHTCVGGQWEACVGDVLPEDEVCDGLDNDCDGESDEGLAQVIEVCDAKDNNCDGQIDEGDPGSGILCNTGLQGVCAAGTTDCVSGAIVCNQNVASSGESCDGLDNNCNGSIDDGNPGGGLSCNTGKTGVCAAGTTACSNGSITCNQNVSSSSEICDGLDNNCDGSADNGNPGSGLSCNTGKTGVCAAGTTACTSGAIVCVQKVASSGEICDGLDNNCDGSADNGNPGGGLSCNTGSAGVCAAGTTACSNGSTTCIQNVSASAEQCNNVDDDCDGQIDEGVKTTYFQDADDDGYGAAGQVVQACSAPAGYVANNSDCNDNNPAIKPTASETCNGFDDDCDGSVDNELGSVSCNTGLPGICSIGYSACIGGEVVCYEDFAPMPETCNGIDDDCDGFVDENNVCNPCFVAGTPVAMADGNARLIEEIRVGDVVLAYDEITGKLTTARVTEVDMHHEADNIVHINGFLRATGNHPFYSSGRWVRADELTVGDALLTLRAEKNISTDITPGAVSTIMLGQEVVTTYNIQVTTPHTYFVNDILVQVKQPLAP